MAASGSMPIMLSSTPRAAAINPLIIELPSSAVTKVKAKISTPSSSGGPILSAITASGAATRISTISLKVSPATEE